jgi:predicted nucleic acid-binding protein
VLASAPFIYLSTVVAAELRAGLTRPGEIAALEDTVFAPYRKRGRIAVPSAASWESLGQTLAWLIENEGLQLHKTPKSFIFDILIAHSCRELGAILVSANERDLKRIQQVFHFDFSPPYPTLR